MSASKYIRVSIQYDTGFGQAVYLIGRNEELGHWNPILAKRLTWSKVFI